MKKRLAPIIACTPLWIAACAIWIGFIVWHTAVSSGGMHMPFNYFDKIMHFGYFVTGGYALALVRKPPLRFWFVVGILTLIGVGHEYWQSLIPGRQGNDIYDLTADFLGAALGHLVATHPKSLFSARPISHV